MKLRPGTPKEAGMSAERVERIADLAAGWVAQGITPALVVLAARRGVVVLHEAFGSLTSEPDSPPLELDTIFPLASITKPITATAAMVLVEDGLLGLNRPVQWYIPEFTGEGKDAVMVHHLLTHTSGLRMEQVMAHVEKKRETVEIPPAGETVHPLVHEILCLAYDAPLWKPPGTEMSYCNYGYELLGEIVRRVSGRSFADFCRERIFQPLGMADTYHVVPDSVTHRIVGRPKGDPSADGMVKWKQLEADWACTGTTSILAWRCWRRPFVGGPRLPDRGSLFLRCFRGRYPYRRIQAEVGWAAMGVNGARGSVDQRGDRGDRGRIGLIGLAVLSGSPVLD